MKTKYLSHVALFLHWQECLQLWPHRSDWHGSVQINPENPLPHLHTSEGKIHLSSVAWITINHVSWISEKAKYGKKWGEGIMYLSPPTQRVGDAPTPSSPGLEVGNFSFFLGTWVYRAQNFLQKITKGKITKLTFVSYCRVKQYVFKTDKQDKSWSNHSSYSLTGLKTNFLLQAIYISFYEIAFHCNSGIELVVPNSIISIIRYLVNLVPRAWEPGWYLVT